VLAVVLSLLFRWLGVGHRTHSATPSHNSALDILKARYAHGEIDRDDYLQRKADLS
jgi:putative membrane protein